MTLREHLAANTSYARELAAYAATCLLITHISWDLFLIPLIYGAFALFFLNEAIRETHHQYNQWKDETRE